MMINANTNKEEKAKIDGSHSEKCIALQSKHFHVSNAIMKTMTRKFFSLHRTFRGMFSK